MIVAFVEVWPGGDQDKAVPLGSIGIHPTTQPGDLLQNFNFELDEAPHTGLEPLKKTGVILGHNPKQSVWKLVRRAIDGVFPNIIT